MATEYTNATTTQLVNALTGTWHQNFFNELGIPVSIMPKIRKAGDIPQ
ncbi:MAG TPA: FGGY family carbohydrate kinase [Fervidobacterium sp.]|nr:FGGY family carbohydrate kinase [Fervidobacterium sp.]